MTANGLEGTKPQQATGSATARLGQPLTIGLTFLQAGKDLASSPLGANTIKLADTDTGEVPQTVEMDVSLTNTSPDTQNNITIAPPDLSVLDPGSAHLPFPMSVSSGPFPSATIDSLAPGGTAKVFYLLNVTGNQDFHVSQLITSGNATTGGTEVSLGANDLHALPTAMLLVDEHLDASNPPRIKTGRPINIDATVTNLSNTRTLDLEPLIPGFSGNGGGTATVDGAAATADGFVPPVVGKLKPADVVDFHILVQTVRNGGTRTTITLGPSGNVIQADGSEKKLQPDDIRLTKDTSPFLVHLDDSDPAPDVVDGPTAAYIFTTAALENFQAWVANGFHAITDLTAQGVFTKIGGGLVDAGGIAVKNAEALGVGVSLIRAELMLHVFWTTLTPEEQQRFAAEVALDTDSASEAWKQFHDAVDAGVLHYFATFENAYQRGDTFGAAEDLGAKLGNGVPEILATFVPNVVLGKIARGLGWGLTATRAIGSTSVARVITLAEKIKTAGIVLNNRKILKGVEVGQNLMASGGKILKQGSDWAHATSPSCRTGRRSAGS